MTGDLVDLDDESTTPPWHERTNTVVGASVAALLALLLMYFAVSCVSQEFNDPDQTPQYFIDPGATTSSTSATTATTSTSYSMSPPRTTDINPGDTTTTSTVRGDSTTTVRRPPSSDDGTTTSRRPRFNETRPAFHPFTPNFFGPNP